MTRRRGPMGADSDDGIHAPSLHSSRAEFCTGRRVAVALIGDCHDGPPPSCSTVELHRQRLARAAKGSTLARRTFLRTDRAARDIVGRLESVNRRFPVALDLSAKRPARPSRKRAGGLSDAATRVGLPDRGRSFRAACSWAGRPGRAPGDGRGNACRSRRRAWISSSPPWPCTGPMTSSARWCRSGAP